MTWNDKQVRDAIAEQASEWFVSNDDAPLDTAESRELLDWLTASPQHVEEFLGVASIARDLNTLNTDAEWSAEALITRARSDEDTTVRSIWSRTIGQGRAAPRRWQMAAMVLALVGAAGLGLSLWKSRSGLPLTAEIETSTRRFATVRGEQKSFRLADNSLLHLNTESVATVRFDSSQRLVIVTAGEAYFEAVHEAKRPFKVIAGAARILDLGTVFDVRLSSDSTVVTVMEGKVAVAPASLGERAATVELHANEQVRVGDQWPLRPVPVDAQRVTAWLHRQIAFDHEPLERVAAEYNRYAPKPVKITTAELRALEVSGTFSTDDPEELLAFLRSLEGVKVEVTPTEVRVSPSHTRPPD